MNKNIQLLQAYYRFLMLGKYVENELFQTDFAQNIKEVGIKTGEHSAFTIKTSLVKKLLEQIHNHPQQKNIFGYLVEVSALRGVFASMRELIETEKIFEKKAKIILKDQWFGFEQIIRLLRNILSHAMSPEITIKKEDFIKQKTFLQEEKKVAILNFDMKYKKYIAQWKGSESYGVSLTVDFRKLKEGQSLFQIFSLHQLYLLAEFCYNLTKLIEPKKPAKRLHSTKK